MMQFLESGGRLLTIAHRAVSYGTNENSLTAIHKSIDAGIDGIEIDVHQTRDHKFVLFHDEYVQFHGNKKKIKDLDLEQLKSSITEKEPIVLLEDALQALCSASLLTILDIKSVQDLDGLVAATREKGMIDKVLIVSFDPAWLFALRRKYANVNIGLIVGFSRTARTPIGFIVTVLALMMPVQVATFIGARAILCSDKCVKYLNVAKAHAAKLSIFMWEASHNEDLPTLIHLTKVDGVLTYRPEEFLEIYQ